MENLQESDVCTYPDYNLDTANNYVLTTSLSTKEDKLAVYESGRSVPTEAQKPFNNGRFSGTDINPMWRIKKLTEIFGPCGLGWYYRIRSKWLDNGADGVVTANVEIELVVNYNGMWSKPIPGLGGNVYISKTSKGIQTSDEAYKMALTDAISVSAKALGIGADVYFSGDRTKYSQTTTTNVEQNINENGNVDWWKIN